MDERRPIALVTGASCGIGLGIAQHLAASGYDLAVVAERPLPDAVDMLESLGAEVVATTVDLREANAPETIVEAALEKFGAIDLLVNNAGTTMTKPIAQTSLEEFDELVALNLRAPWAATRAVAGPMAAMGGGCIVNISSVHASRGLTGHSVYAATKGAIEAMTRELAVELAPVGIRVNAVAPGLIETDRMRDLPWYTSGRGASLIPWRRIGRPSDVAALVAFLADDAAEYITGAVLAVDGGTGATMALDWPAPDAVASESEAAS